MRTLLSGIIYLFLQPQVTRQSWSDIYAASLFYSLLALQRKYSAQRSADCGHTAETSSIVFVPLSDAPARRRDSRSEAAIYITVACSPRLPLAFHTTLCNVRGKCPSIPQADNRLALAGPYTR